MRGAGAVDVLLFQAERTANCPVLLLAVPKRAVVDLKVVAGPRPPAGELARRRLDGAVMAGRGILGNEIHRALQLAQGGRRAQLGLPCRPVSDVWQLPFPTATGLTIPERHDR